MKDLFHGTTYDINKIDVTQGKGYKDFGKGFYMGTDRNQSLTLICNYPKAKIYTLNVDLSQLKLIDMEAGLDWALLVAYHRGKMESIKNTKIYERYANLSKGYDMISGMIANDRMFVVLDRFFNGEITDFALIQSLSVLKLGKQYVALTENACRKIQIADEQITSGNDKAALKQLSEVNRSKGIVMANEICRKYRREGRFFDEILEEGE